MKCQLWIAVIAILPSVTACNRTVGECWPRGEGPENGGVGSGGVIMPGGTGDYGDTPPDPAGFKIPEADCNIADQGPCTEKCLASYETAATTCGKIPDDAQRKTCQEGAYAGYKTCKENCQQASDSNCAEKYQNCVNYAPTSCLAEEAGKSVCNRCLERCNAGDSPSSKCRKCLF